MRIPGEKMKIAGWFALLISVQVGTLHSGDITGSVDAVKSKYMRDAVIFIEYAEGNFPPPEKAAVMDQVGLEFVPNVLPVLSGTTVDFLNSDKVLHNVFTPDNCSEKFNLGSWPTGEVRSHRFDGAPCLAVMLCNVHPEMEAYILILQNRYFAKTDEDGSFRIEDIPGGTYNLKVWHKRLRANPVEVAVPDVGSVEVNFGLTR